MYLPNNALKLELLSPNSSSAWMMNNHFQSIVHLKIFGLLNDNLYPSFLLSDSPLVSGKTLHINFRLDHWLTGNHPQTAESALLPNVGLRPVPLASATEEYFAILLGYSFTLRSLVST